METPVIGDKYGNWEVISTKTKISRGRHILFNVKRICGEECYRTATCLRNNKTHSCKSCCRTQLFKNSFSLSYFNRIKARAKKINCEYDLDYDYVYDLINNQDYKCALSGLPIFFRKQWKLGKDQTASLDRIDNTKGYIKGNVQWVHKNINMMKHTSNQEDFIKMCKLVATKCG